MGSIIVRTLLKAFSKVVTYCGVLAVRGRPVNIRFNADPVPLKLVTHNKIVFRAGTGLCLSKLKCKRNARCVAVTDWFQPADLASPKLQKM